MKPPRQKLSPRQVLRRSLFWIPVGVILINIDGPLVAATVLGAVFGSFGTLFSLTFLVKGESEKVCPTCHQETP